MATRLTHKTVAQTWRTFLANHVRDLASLDVFTVPTARLRVLFVLVVLVHHRGRVVHFNVTELPKCLTVRHAPGKMPEPRMVPVPRIS